MITKNKKHACALRNVVVYRMYKAHVRYTLVVRAEKHLYVCVCVYVSVCLFVFVCIRMYEPVVRAENTFCVPGS